MFYSIADKDTIVLTQCNNVVMLDDKTFTQRYENMLINLNIAQYSVSFLRKKQCTRKSEVEDENFLFKADSSTFSYIARETTRIKNSSRSLQIK